MRKYVEEFPKQIIEAIGIAEKAKLSPVKSQIKNVVICGLGGSGIGGTIMADLYGMEINVPINVYKDYFIPNYTNENTLVISCSYSGNTEETVKCTNDAIKKNAKVVCITSGGEIEKIAQSSSLDLIKIPGGYPPRSAFGYSFTQLLKVFHFFKLINDDVLKLLKDSHDLIEKEHNKILEEATKISDLFFDRFPVIYACGGSEGIATRFKQQVNENSKELCYYGVVPEMNHNELVGWTKKRDNFAILYIKNITDYERNRMRMDINETIFKKFTSNIYHLNAKGNHKIISTIYLINLLDWVSLLWAEKKKIDPQEVKVIDFLKGELKK